MQTTKSETDTDTLVKLAKNLQIIQKQLSGGALKSPYDQRLKDEALRAANASIELVNQLMAGESNPIDDEADSDSAHEGLPLNIDEAIIAALENDALRIYEVHLFALYSNGDKHSDVTIAIASDLPYLLDVTNQAKLFYEKQIGGYIFQQVFDEFCDFEKPLYPFAIEYLKNAVQENDGEIVEGILALFNMNETGIHYQGDGVWVDAQGKSFDQQGVTVELIKSLYELFAFGEGSAEIIEINFYLESLRADTKATP